MIGCVGPTPDAVVVSPGTVEVTFEAIVVTSKPVVVDTVVVIGCVGPTPDAVVVVSPGTVEVTFEAVVVSPGTVVTPDAFVLP